jgi:NAD(P)-dependent dehydrogenase (short-subunit alcohol dehydrogenase family)
MSLDRSLAGKVALVTGGVRGIGRAIAEGLAAEGAKVLLTSRDQPGVERAASEIAAQFQVESIGYHCDVCEPESIEQLFDAIGAEFTNLDILVNNSGVAGPLAKLDQLPLAAWNEILATNLTGPFLVTQGALPRMCQGSTIVNILSTAARQAFPGMGGYVASKFGALGFSNCLREELRPKGIRVLAVLPGATDTEIWQQFWPQAPRGKMLQAANIASAVIAALRLPPNAAIEEIVINPTGGAL